MNAEARSAGGVILHAAFASERDARAALDRLAADGVASGAIEVRSSIPLGEAFFADVAPPVSRIPLFAVMGGLAGGIAAYLVATWPPPMGLPPVSGPPLALIVFEGLAVGAILVAVARVLWECGLLRRGPAAGPLDANLAAGAIVIAARRPAGASRDWTTGAVAVASSS
jgi:hypothetical protein